jgi:hypothetical protein
VQHLIEDVVVALPRELMNDAKLLQEVGLDQCTADVALVVKKDLYQLAEPRAVIIPQRFCIPKGFQ